MGKITIRKSKGPASDNFVRVKDIHKHNRAWRWKKVAIFFIITTLGLGFYIAHYSIDLKYCFVVTLF